MEVSVHSAWTWDHKHSDTVVTSGCQSSLCKFLNTNLMTMSGSQCPFNVGMRPQTQCHSYTRLSIITQCKCLNTSPRTIYRCQCPLSVDMTPQRQWYSYMRLSIITRCKRLNTSPRTICGCQCPFSVDMRPQRQRYSLHEIVNNHSVNVWTQAQGQCV